jgi:hypothetical protein
LDAQVFAIVESLLDLGWLLGWLAGWLVVGWLAGWACWLVGFAGRGSCWGWFVGLLVALGWAGLGCACWLTGNWLAGSLAGVSISFLYGFSNIS